MKQGWEIKKLTEVVWFQEGPGVRKHQYTSSGVKLLNVANLVNGKVDLSTSDRYISSEEAYGKYKHFLVDEGDLILASSGIQVEYIEKKMGFIEKHHLPLCMNTSTIRFKSIDKNVLDITYFMYFLKSYCFKEQLFRLITGVAQLNYGPSHLKQMSIPVPPLPEQEKIVSELDCLSGIIEKKRQQLKELDALAQSIFYEMFGNPVDNDRGWEVVQLSSAVDEKCPISYGIVQPMDDIQDGVPIVRPVDLIETFVYNRGLKKTSREISDSYKRTILRGDEILMCVRGTTGIVSLATEELRGCNTTRGIVPLFFTKMNRWFMFHLFKSDAMVNLIAEHTYGIALKQINIKDLRQLPIVIPPLPLQQSFAQKIEAIEQQKALIKQSIAEVETLFNARMQEYFE